MCAFVGGNTKVWNLEKHEKLEGGVEKTEQKTAEEKEIISIFVIVIFFFKITFQNNNFVIILYCVPYFSWLLTIPAWLKFNTVQILYCILYSLYMFAGSITVLQLQVVPPFCQKK